MLLIALRRGPWKINRHINILHNGVFFDHEDLGAFFLVVAMPMKRTVDGQRERSQARKHVAKSRSTHG